MTLAVTGLGIFGAAAVASTLSSPVAFAKAHKVTHHKAKATETTGKRRHATTGAKKPFSYSFSLSCSNFGSPSCYQVVFSISGARSLSGTNVTANMARCSSALSRNSSTNGGDVELNVLMYPKPPAASFSLSLDNYKGSGTYSTSDNDASVTILDGTTTQYGPGGGTVTAVAQTDGTVTVTFSGVANQSDASQTVSGHVTFTCKNA